MRDPWSTLNLRVTDRNTKRLRPARFHIKRADGECYTPPAEASADSREIPQVIQWDQFGRNLHCCSKNAQKSTFLSRGEATIPVPAEELKLYVANGYERKPIVRVFLARAGETVHLDLPFDSIENMPAAGWHSCDMHIHTTRREEYDDLILAHMMAAEDLAGVNNMVFKVDGEVMAHQRNMGHRGNHHRLHHHHQVIAGGEEYRDAELYGHMISAGIKKVIEPISTGMRLGRRENYPLFTQVCDWTHEQGGVAGWAHGGCQIKLHESLPVEAALKKLDFIEGIQFNNFSGFYFWYRLLNCGLRISITGGSDFPFGSDNYTAPWYTNLGLDRTYVNIGKNKKFDYGLYIEGLRKGRSFATNGPLIFLEVDGKGPGSNISLPSGKKKVKILARAVAQYPLDRLEILINGAVVHMEDGKGGPREIAVETQLKLDGSSWIAARVRGDAAPALHGGNNTWHLHAHTSPVYVKMQGKPIVHKADATWLADYVRFVGSIYEKRGAFKTAAQREELRGNFARALKFYERLLR
jgi:TolB protein